MLILCSARLKNKTASKENVGCTGQKHDAVFTFVLAGTAWWSSEYLSLLEEYVQNASLEFDWTRVVFEERTIAGTILVFFLQKHMKDSMSIIFITGARWCIW